MKESGDVSDLGEPWVCPDVLDLAALRRVHRKHRSQQILARVCSDRKEGGEVEVVWVVGGREESSVLQAFVLRHGSRCGV